MVIFVGRLIFKLDPYAYGSFQPSTKCWWHRLNPGLYEWPSKWRICDIISPSLPHTKNIQRQCCVFLFNMHLSPADCSFSRAIEKMTRHGHCSLHMMKARGKSLRTAQRHILEHTIACFLIGCRQRFVRHRMSTYYQWGNTCWHFGQSIVQPACFPLFPGPCSN